MQQRKHLFPLLHLNMSANSSINQSVESPMSTRSPSPRAIRKTEISLMSYPVLIVLDALKIWFFLNSDLVDSNLRHLMLFK